MRRRSLVVAGSAVGLGLVGAGVVAATGGRPSGADGRPVAGVDAGVVFVLGAAQPETCAEIVVLDRGRRGGKWGVRQGCWSGMCGLPVGATRPWGLGWGCPSSRGRRPPLHGSCG